MLDILAADGGAATAAVGTARPSTDLRTHHSLTHARTHSRAHGARTHAPRPCVSLRVYTHVDAHVCLHVGACLHTRAPRFPHPHPSTCARARMGAHTRTRPACIIQADDMPSAACNARAHAHAHRVRLSVCVRARASERVRALMGVSAGHAVCRRRARACAHVPGLHGALAAIRIRKITANPREAFD